MTAMITSETELNESWTDGLVGITHAVPFGKWSWANRFDAGFGQSEGSLLFNTAINRHFGKHFLVNLNFTFKSVEFGDRGEIANSDFYLYDVKEPAFGLGVLFML